MKLPLGLTRTDVALPSVLAAVGSVEALLADVHNSVAIATMLAAGLLLCVRRRWPVVTAVGAFSLLSLQARRGVPEDDLVVPLAIVLTACFSLGRYAGPVRGVAGLVVVNVMVHLSERLELPSAQDVLWVLTLTAGPWLAGRLMLDHVRRGDALAAQAHQLMLEQRQVSERLVADERRRIARDLHDVIAHSVSVMVVQAGAGADLLDRDPAATQRALEEIQRAGRSALDETGRLLHLLRDDAGPEVGPQPSVGDLPGLVDAFRTAGLDVELEIHGPTDGLPAGVDLSVFRIVEEGLTNALKHAQHGHVQVSVRRDPAGVDVDLLSTDGAGAEPAASGLGLIGMRERVAIFGGDLDTGPTANGGHQLHARLPILPQVAP